MVLEKISNSRSLSLKHIDGQSFTITKIDTIECVVVGMRDKTPTVFITTKEKYRDTETNIQYDRFYTTRLCVVAYLTKESTLKNLEKNGSIGPFGCMCYDSGPISFELCRAMTDRGGNVVFGDPVLPLDEAKEIMHMSGFNRRSVISAK